MVAVKTPAPQRAAGRRKLASQGKALSDGSYPIPNVSYLKKALRAVGRAGPGKRPALARLIRKRAREMGAWNVVKGSWADNTQGAKAMSNALFHALCLAGTIPASRVIDAAYTDTDSDGDSGGDSDGGDEGGVKRKMTALYNRVYLAMKKRGMSPAQCHKLAMQACYRYAEKNGYPKPDPNNYTPPDGSGKA